MIVVDLVVIGILSLQIDETVKFCYVMDICVT